MGRYHENDLIGRESPRHSETKGEILWLRVAPAIGQQSWTANDPVRVDKYGLDDVDLPSAKAEQFGRRFNFKHANFAARHAFPTRLLLAAVSTSNLNLKRNATVVPVVKIIKFLGLRPIMLYNLGRHGKGKSGGKKRRVQLTWWSGRTAKKFDGTKLSPSAV
ncbi:hypothetical protein BDZ97DRAFT_1763186 [Flammula alnicola]|nr:hypothetical protein BDZ97DRAFT_1763186 [Flammula alnicola]